MAFHLTHLAETLFAEMVNRVPACVLSIPEIRELADEDFVRSISPVAECESRLRPFGGLSFDGACRIDVLLRLRSDAATACELKLGRTRLTANRVNRDWLVPCTPSSHADRRWKGNIMAALERNFDGPASDDLVAGVDDSGIPLTREWLLVARRQTLLSWQALSPEFSSSVRCVAFEDVVRGYGGTIAFNALVKEVVNFDYCDKWGIQMEGAG